MNTLSANPKSYLDTMLRYGIGLDPRFFERIADTPNFPPHNITQYNEDHYRLTLAVAGFAEDELDITMHNDLLTVAGQKNDKNSDDPMTLLYNGIAFRDFTRQFKVGEHVFVEGASLKDGLLQIDLMRRLPEAMKPKKIIIGEEEKKTKQPPRQAA